MKNILPRTNPDGSVRSIGNGIEAEVLCATFSQLQKHPGQWFYPRIGDTASIAVMHTYSSAANVSLSRLEGMKVFGALCALLLIQGMPPLPLSPLVLQWVVNDQNIHSLHSELVSEWHPELSSTIKQWLALDPGDSIAPFQAHFSAWHENQVIIYYSH